MQVIGQWDSPIPFLTTEELMVILILSSGFVALCSVSLFKKHASYYMSFSLLDVEEKEVHEDDMYARVVWSLLDGFVFWSFQVKWIQLCPLMMILGGTFMILPSIQSETHKANTTLSITRLCCSGENQERPQAGYEPGAPVIHRLMFLSTLLPVFVPAGSFHAEAQLNPLVCSLDTYRGELSSVITDKACSNCTTNVHGVAELT